MRTALSVTILLLATATAYAGANIQGANIQGANIQGANIQGANIQGANIQGANIQGANIQGMSMSTATVNLTLDKTNIKGSVIDAVPFSCSHNLIFQGQPLPASCNACAQIVNQYDSYCGQYWWDSYCVAEAQDWCSFEAVDLVGSEFDTKVKLANNTTTTMKLHLDAVSVSPDPTPYWVWNGTQWVNTSFNENGDVLHYDLKIHQPAVNTCGFKTKCTISGCYKTYSCWQSQAESFTPICGDSSIDGLHNKAVPVAGKWNSCVGPGCGGKTPGTEGQEFAFSCHDDGAIAKCVERFQYQPWEDPFSPTKAPLHESCVRMARADYCGDGQTHTYNGNWIDVYDHAGVQALDPEGEKAKTGGTEWGNDALWNPNGAFCVVTGRFEMNDPNGGTLQQYVDTHSTCQGKFIPAGGQYAERWRCGMVAEQPGTPKIDGNPEACREIAAAAGVRGLSSGTWCDGYAYGDNFETHLDIGFNAYEGNRSISLPFGW